MKQCPFCGTEWEGNGSCPNCGVKPEMPQDDSMFRPPEGGTRAAEEASPEFEVEKLLRWECPKNDSSEAEGKTEQEEEPLAKEEEEDSLSLKKPLKRWQKLTMAAAAVVVAVALVVRMWPQTLVLPQVPAFFVQNDTLMALPVNGEPQKVTEYALELEYSLQVSPDQKSMAWTEPGVSTVKLLPAMGEEEKVWEDRYASSPRFSQDGKYLYLSMDDEETGNPALWQYDMESGEERMIGPLYWDYFLENGALLAVFDGTSLTVYDANTAEKKWSQEADMRWMAFSGNQLYFAITGEETSQLCCWENGEVEVLLENVDCLYLRENGVVYIQCYLEETVPAMDLIKNDLNGVDGGAILQTLQNMEIHSPGRTLYCLDGQALHQIGENQRLYFFPHMDKSAAVCSIEYPSAEEVKGTISLTELYDLWVQQQNIITQTQVETLWPCESSLDYIAVKEKLYPLPEDVPQNPYFMQTAGDWVCFYLREENILWSGKIEEGHVVSKDVLAFEETMNFWLTEKGDIYYCGTDTIGPLFKNGIPVDTQMHLNSLQYMDDGTVYFLSGSSAFDFTLNRLHEGKLERLAEEVKEFTAYTQDYVTYLQYWEDEQGQDLFTCTDGKKPVLVAEQVEKLLPVVETHTPRFDIDLAQSYVGGAGYINMSKDVFEGIM